MTDNTCKLWYQQTAEHDAMLCGARYGVLKALKRDRREKDVLKSYVLLMMVFALRVRVRVRVRTAGLGCVGF
jgi:hypothetical protein